MSEPHAPTDPSARALRALRELQKALEELPVAEAQSFDAYKSELENLARLLSEGEPAIT
jgi:hypothetical protein